MNDKNLNQNDPLVQLKKAKPEITPESRVEYLVQKSESKRDLIYRASLSPRFRLTLLATPAILAVVAGYSLNLYSSQPSLSVILGGLTIDHKPYQPNEQEILADCQYSNIHCNDIGYRVGFQLDWNYTISSNISDEAPQGSVYKLTKTGREKEIAETLAKEFNLADPIESSNIKTTSFIGYSSPHGKEKLVDVIDMENQSSVLYENYHADDWYLCQHGMGNEKICDSIAYEESPTKGEAIKDSIRLLSLMGINSGTDVRSLREGEYLITFEELTGGVATNSYPVLNGQAAALPFSIYWSKGSAQVSSIDGLLYSFEDMGNFKTLSAKQAVHRMNGYVALPSMSEERKFSQTRLEAMSAAEQNRLRNLAKDLPTGTPIKIDVKITQAIHTYVTIRDAKYQAWVVPGISYYDDTGYLGSVLSLDSEYIQMGPTDK
jgi:hypothetical protein